MEFELKDLHVIILCVTAVAIVVADHDAYAYVRGRKSVLDSRRVQRLHYLVLAGLVGMILTGVGLFYDAWGELLYNTTFYIKMAFVLALIVNGMAIGKLMPITSDAPYSNLSTHDRRRLLVSGAVSGLAWLGAAVTGLFFL